MMYIALAIILAFDLLIVKWKFEHQRYADAIMDVSLLVIINYVLGGTLGGEIISAVAAMIISLYLLKFPPDYNKMLGG